MPHIELLMSLLAGACGGLFGVLWSGLVSGEWLRRLRVPEPPGVGSWQSLVADAVLHAGAGAVLGLLFWTGWGLIALVNVPWYAAGVAFGIASWAGAALPAVLSFGTRLRLPAPLTIVHAVEWLVSCVAAGVLCALTWQRIV